MRTKKPLASTKILKKQKTKTTQAVSFSGACYLHIPTPVFTVVEDRFLCDEPVSLPHLQ